MRLSRTRETAFLRHPPRRPAADAGGVKRQQFGSLKQAAPAFVGYSTVIITARPEAATPTTESNTMKVLLIAAALAPLTLSSVNSTPLSDGEFARADGVSKMFIVLGGFAAAYAKCGTPILDKTAHLILESPVANQYYNQHKQEVAVLMQNGSDTFNKDVAEQGQSAACASMVRGSTALSNRLTHN